MLVVGIIAQKTTVIALTLIARYFSVYQKFMLHAQPVVRSEGAVFFSCPFYFVYLFVCRFCSNCLLFLFVCFLSCTLLVSHFSILWSLEVIATNTVSNRAFFFLSFFLSFPSVQIMSHELMSEELQWLQCTNIWTKSKFWETFL